MLFQMQEYGFKYKKASRKILETKSAKHLNKKPHKVLQVRSALQHLQVRSRKFIYWIIET